jgi:hypothetical protein
MKRIDGHDGRVPTNGERAPLEAASAEAPAARAVEEANRQAPGRELAPRAGGADRPEGPAPTIPTLPGIASIRRKVRKSKRRTRMRAKTIAMKRLTKEEIRLGALLYPPEDIERPSTRAACLNGPRPCPFVSCKHHLYLDVNPDTGSIKINFPDLEVWEMKDTCSLDVADRGGVTLEEVGEILNLTRERIRQVEVRGLLKLKMAAPDLTLPPPRNDNDL